MQIARVDDWKAGPKAFTVEKPPAPSDGEIQLKVLASGLHQVVRGRASGTHYSAKSLPHIPGIDCVGRDEATGKLYYTMGFGETFGTFVEYVNVRRDGILIALPDDVDVASFAVAVNPAMSSWMALTQRTRDLPKGFTVLVIGATSASGKLAAHAAKALGAGRVVGAARKVEPLQENKAYDDYIVLRDTASETDFSQADADVVLDYVWGDVAHHFLSTLKTKKPVQYVHIGGLSGKSEIPLSGPLLRSTNLFLSGAGPGSWTMTALEKELETLVPAMASWPRLDAVKVNLKDIAEAWNQKSSGGRVVVIP
jgi:NADPH:quinone reductase-like Zn-dependent oxidoreductase